MIYLCVECDQCNTVLKITRQNIRVEVKADSPTWLFLPDKHFDPNAGTFEISPHLTTRGWCIDWHPGDNLPKYTCPKCMKKNRIAELKNELAELENDDE